MHARMYACMCVCIYVCMYVSVCMHSFMYVCMHVFVCVHLLIYLLRKPGICAILGLSCANSDSRFVRAILGLPAQFQDRERSNHGLAQTLDWLKPWIGSIPGLSKHIIAAPSWYPGLICCSIP